VWGYPIIPSLFIAAMMALVVNTLLESPRESLIGVALVLLGAPTYFYWRRTKGAR
jgi:APA family basic amino acid/polyamine antiporter